MGLSGREMGVVAIAAPIFAAKGYLLSKYLRWKKGRQLENQPGYNNRRYFAKLPRRKQREVIYARRARVRDLEAITYGPGYQPRRRS